jgi:isopentenyl-diphosphate delta-isomerase type 1
MADELLDVVSDTDQVISREMRSVVHHRGLLHRGAHVFLFNPHNKLLVQTRSQHSDTYPLALDCSVSEHVKAGETYRQAALRGLWEELSIKDVRIKPVIKFKMEYGKGDFEICVLYTGQANLAAVQFDPGEVQSVSFYHLKQLKKMLDDKPSDFSKWLAQLIFWVYGLPNELQILKTFKGPHPRRFL